MAIDLNVSFEAIVATEEIAARVQVVASDRPVLDQVFHDAPSL